jgi:hypothetical protein
LVLESESVQSHVVQTVYLVVDAQYAVALIEGLDLGLVIRGQRKRHRFQEHVRLGFSVSCRGGEKREQQCQENEHHGQLSNISN